MATEPLRIVQLIPSFVLGGAEVFATGLSQALLEAGHDVHLVALRDEGPLRRRLSPELSRRVVVVPKRGRVDPTLLPRLAATWRRLNAQVVHSHLFTALAWGVVSARLSGLGPVTVYTEHACHPDDEAFVPWVRRALTPLVDQVIACSPAAAAAIALHRWFPGAPVLTIPNGIPTAGRPQAPLDGSPLHLGTLGRLVPIKGHRHLIDAVGLLRDRDVAVRLTIHGEGPLQAELQARVDQLRLQERVRLAPPTDRVAEVLTTFDLFVLPSLSEAMPMTLLEAAAAGLPLLVTTGGGARTLLDDGAGGWAVEPANAEALAERIAAYAGTDLPTRRQLGAQSAEAVRQGYDLSRCAERTATLYRRLLAARA